LHGELLKLGFDISERTVSRLMPNRRKGPSQTWKTFLANHVGQLVSIDFLTLPTLQLRVLFVFVVTNVALRDRLPQNSTSTFQDCTLELPDRDVVSFSRISGAGEGRRRQIQALQTEEKARTRAENENNNQS